FRVVVHALEQQRVAREGCVRLREGDLLRVGPVVDVRERRAGVAEPERTERTGATDDELAPAHTPTGKPSDFVLIFRHRIPPRWVLRDLDLPTDLTNGMWQKR